MQVHLTVSNIFIIIIFYKAVYININDNFNQPIFKLQLDYLKKNILLNLYHSKQVDDLLMNKIL